VADNYEIRIKGRVGDSVLEAFEGMTATVEPVETVLHGPIADQQALHELLAEQPRPGQNAEERGLIGQPTPQHRPRRVGGDLPPLPRRDGPRVMSMTSDPHRVSDISHQRTPIRSASHLRDP
jgi:hypothetical protein